MVLWLNHRIENPYRGIRRRRRYSNCVRNCIAKNVSSDGGCALRRMRQVLSCHALVFGDGLGEFGYFLKLKLVNHCDNCKKNDRGLFSQFNPFYHMCEKIITNFQTSCIYFINDISFMRTFCIHYICFEDTY